MCLLDKHTPPFVYQWEKRTSTGKPFIYRKKKKREVKRRFGRLACPLRTLLKTKVTCGGNFW